MILSSDYLIILSSDHLIILYSSASQPAPGSQPVNPSQPAPNQSASQGAGLPDLPGSSQPGHQPHDLIANDPMILLSFDLMIL